MDFSSDNGASWATTLTADSGFTSLISDNAGTLLVLSKPGDIVTRSTDKGKTWTSLGSGPVGDRFDRIMFLGKTRLLGFTKSGLWYRSTNVGSSWEPIYDISDHP